VSGAPDIAGVPLVAPRPAAEALAWSGGARVSVREFLADVAALAARLPGRAQVVNLCADRYRFTVGFAAALVRGQVSLLPPSRAPEFLLRLAEQYPDVYCLADEAVDWCPLEVVHCPERLICPRRAARARARRRRWQPSSTPPAPPVRRRRT
jgi:hypothetical protein